MKFKRIQKFWKRYKKTIFGIVGIFLFLVLFVGIYNTNKSLPEGTSFEGEVYYVDEGSVEFLYDLTYLDGAGEKVHEQVIFDRIFDLIDSAEKFILIDMFLFGADENAYRNLSEELASHLIEKKNSNPEIKINLISDEYNTVYGSYIPPFFKDLEENGIGVVYTNMNRMRDSNPIYSSFWRVLFYPFGVSSECKFSFMKFGGRKVCIRSALKLLNFKVNHRKLIVADNNEKVVSIVTSANPHDGSSAHSNVALIIDEKIWEDIYFSEKSIVDFSKGDFKGYDFEEAYETNSSEVSVQFLTEMKIKDGLINELDNTVEGDSIEVMMFYISNRDVVRALLDASERGVEVKLVLDPNKDSFGREKDGVPNRPVAHELVDKSKGKIQIRWYSTNGEQFHTKMIVVRKQDGKTIVFIGSSNLTKRNNDDYNLESDVKMVANNNSIIIQEIYTYFERIWNNEGGTYTADYSTYEDTRFVKNLQYEFQEFTGLSTF